MSDVCIPRNHPSRRRVARTFLTFSMDATALVETDFFATAVLETTRTPVKEVAKADMMTKIVFVPESDDAAGGEPEPEGDRPTDRVGSATTVTIHRVKRIVSMWYRMSDMGR